MKFKHFLSGLVLFYSFSSLALPNLPSRLIDKKTNEVIAAECVSNGNQACSQIQYFMKETEATDYQAITPLLGTYALFSFLDDPATQMKFFSLQRKFFLLSHAQDSIFDGGAQTDETTFPRRENGESKTHHVLKVSLVAAESVVAVPVITAGAVVLGVADLALLPVRGIGSLFSVEDSKTRALTLSKKVLYEKTDIYLSHHTWTQVRKNLEALK